MCKEDMVEFESNINFMFHWRVNQVEFGPDCHGDALFALLRSQ